MFQALGIDAFTALSLLYLGGLIGAVMCLAQIFLQIAHDRDGFGWKGALYPSLAFSLALGVLVGVGGAIEGAAARIYLGDAVAVAAVLVPTTLCGAFLGRAGGWLAMRALAFLG